MSPKSKQFYEFADFRLDVSEKILRRGDNSVPLTPKVFETLQVLVENAGRLLEKDELMLKLWQDRFVEENNLTANIKMLRKALGDDSSQPRFIETVPRRGYRFIAEVRESAAEEKAAESATVPVEAAKFKKFLVAASAVIILGLSFFGLWYAQSKNLTAAAPILSAPFGLETLTTNGKTRHAVISLDGKTVIYTQRIEKKQSIWLRQLETGNNVEIVPPSDDVYYGLALSPDGNFLYFVRAPKTVSRQFDVFRVSIFGGIPTKIIGDADGWISISPDGKQISFVRCYFRDDDFCSLWIADAPDGRNERKIVSRPRPTRISDNEISADGKTIVFAAGHSETAANEFTLMEVEIETGAERQVTPEKFFDIKSLARLPDRNSFLVTASKIPNKHFRLWLISDTGGGAVPLTKDSESYAGLSLDKPANLLVSTQGKEDYHLHLFDMTNPAKSRVLADATSVSLAPNGKILFSSMMSGNDEIWSINVDGSGQRQLTNSPADENAVLASPADNSVFFASNRTGEVQVWKMGMDGSNQTQITRQEGGTPLSVSPDGRWLYYHHSLHKTLWRIAAEGGEEQLVFNKRKHQLAVSPDGSQAVFSEEQAGENVLMVVRLADGQTIKTFNFAVERASLTHLKWSPDGNYLTYILAAGEYEYNTLWRQPLDAAAVQKIADLGDERITGGGFALAPDGKTFALTKGNWRYNAVFLKGLK